MEVNDYTNILLHRLGRESGGDFQAVKINTPTLKVL